MTRSQDVQRSRDRKVTAPVGRTSTSTRTLLASSERLARSAVARHDGR